MIAYMTNRPFWARRTAALLAVAVLSTVGCRSTDEILSVEDPDIINPGNVASASGANAVRLGALARLNAATTGGDFFRAER